MAVVYINGQYYDRPDTQNYGRSFGGSLGNIFGNRGDQLFQAGITNGTIKPINAPTNAPQMQDNFGGNPFTSAMSGTQTGTLQPYINRLTQQSSDALNGGLLNQQPQPMQAADAGGVAQNSQVPQGGLLDEMNFAKRPWMGA